MKSAQGSGVKAKALVLKKTEYKHSDYIIHTLCEDGSRRVFFAKGAANSKKRFGGGVLNATHYIDILFQENKNTSSDFYILKEARLIDDFAGIRKSYECLDTGLTLLKTCERLTHHYGDDVENKNLFLLLGHSLRSLEKSVPPKTVLFLFRLFALNFEGVLSNTDDFDFLNQGFAVYKKVEGLQKLEIPELAIHEIKTQINAYLNR